MDQQIIKVDNVFRYATSMSDKEVNKALEQKLIPPFQYQKYVWRNIVTIEAVVEVCELDEINVKKALRQYLLDNGVEENNIRWIGRIDITYCRGREKYPFGTMISYYDRNGYDSLGATTISPTPQIDEKITRYNKELGDGFNPLEAFVDDMQSDMSVIHIVNALLHCKNVRIVDEPLTRQQRRYKERKGGTYYKVLDIEPFKKQVRNERQPGESEIKRAMHICRGHFATYTEDRPLFGKVSGTFWKPAHVKGNRSVGKVVKDYNVVTDTED